MDTLYELPEGETFNSKYMCERPLPDLRATRPFHRKGRTKPMIILHMDNTKHHRSKMTVQKIAESRMTSALHPPFSCDIAPPDFYLFGSQKDQLRKRECHNEEELFQTVSKIICGFVQAYWWRHLSNSRGDSNRSVTQMIIACRQHLDEI
jgi:transposase